MGSEMCIRDSMTPVVFQSMQVSSSFETESNDSLSMTPLSEDLDDEKWDQALQEVTTDLVQRKWWHGA